MVGREHSLGEATVSHEHLDQTLPGANLRPAPLRHPAIAFSRQVLLRGVTTSARASGQPGDAQKRPSSATRPTL